MRVYLLALFVAASVTFLMTPLARWCALRWGAITAVRTRDVHAIPTPRLGGMAMFAGMDFPASSARTREKLDWHPSGPGLIADLDAMNYN